MTIALIVLHAAPEADNPRADTAVRLAGAMLAEGKEVRLFLAGTGDWVAGAGKGIRGVYPCALSGAAGAGFDRAVLWHFPQKPGMGRVFTRRCYKKFHEGSVRLDQRRG